MKLWLVRHGQTDWNVAKRYTGQTDVPLAAEGHRQAVRLGNYLSGLRVDAFFCSDLRRAQQTAQAIAVRCGVTASLDRRLREASFGRWEGLSFAEASEQFPNDVEAWIQDPMEAAPTEGESLAALRHRIADWLAFLDGRAIESALVVSHGGPIRVLLCELLGVPLVRHYRFRIAPGDLAVIEKFDEEGILCYLGPAK